MVDSNELQRLTAIPRNTLTSRLKELKNKKEIDNEAASKNGKVVSEYFLTEHEKIKRLWKIDSRQKQDDKQDKVKAFLLITYFAAFGYEDLKIEEDPSKAKLGDVMILTSNKDRVQEYSLGGEKKLGVSINDLINKLPGINGAAIFTYMDYSESELKGHFRSLIKRNPPVITALQQLDVDSDTRYGIANKELEVFIKKCCIIFYMVRSRMEYTWKYIRWPKPDSNEANWYVTLFGTKITGELIKKIEKKRHELDKKNGIEKQDFINSVYDEIKHNDINIIASYNQLLSGNYEYLRKKYRLIVNPLLKVCYPHFMRTLHKKNEI
jgi:hypothetical protein